VASRFHLRCRLLRKHRWVRRRGEGDEEFWECRDCGAAFSGAPPTGEGRYSMPAPMVGPYRDDR
jgi:ribosomal protein L37AE/L43A